MDSLTQPLERVVESIEYFIRTPSVRLLYVETSQMLRAAVLQHICAAERFDFNKSPFFVFESPTVSGDDGWGGRAEELRADWQVLLENGGKDTLPALWAAETASAPLARFGLELGRALAALRAPVSGLTIVLAPVWVTEGEPWRSGLSTLIAQPALSKARFVVVETETSHTEALLAPLGTRAEKVGARVDEAAVAAEAKARLEAMKSAPPDTSGPRMIGAAGPDTTPPRRMRQPLPLTAEQAAAKARELGIPAAYLQPPLMQRLNVLLMAAALAVREGNRPEGVRLQREARDFCVEHAMHREATVNELVLGGYLLQGGSIDRALEMFGDARRRAEKHGFAEQAVQAQMAVGAALFLLKRLDEAALAYADAGQLGLQMKSVVLAIEAFRMCGQIAATRGHLEQASTAFRRALSAAEESPAAAKSSTAPEAARQLAVLCRKHGLTAQADSLDQTAAALEAAALAPPTADAQPTSSKT